MKLEYLSKDPKSEMEVICPRTKEKTNANRVCKKCVWLNIVTCDDVRCGWSKKKQEVQEGKIIYETW